MGELHAEQTRSEEHVAFQWRKVRAAVHFCTDTIVKFLKRLVDLLDAESKFVVRIRRRQLQFYDKTIEAVHDKHKVEFLLKCVPHHALNVDRQAYNYIHDQNHTV